MSKGRTSGHGEYTLNSITAENAESAEKLCP